MVVLGVMSVFTNINLGLRYVLPVFPYLFISAGKLVPWAAGISRVGMRRAAATLIGFGLAATVTSTLLIAPHYLAYFNLIAGGPDQGAAHLIDSNLDWGQDLIGLRDWLAKHAPGERVGIAYFGQINPSIFSYSEGRAFDWFLPPPVPGTARPFASVPPPGSRPRPRRLEPGLYAVSASLVRGLPWRVYDSDGWLPAANAWIGAFSYFQKLRPVANVGHSILIYRVSTADAARLAPIWDQAGPAKN